MTSTGYQLRRTDLSTALAPKFPRISYFNDGKAAFLILRGGA